MDKRCFDFLISAIGLLFLSPFLIGVAFLIRCIDGSPVIFTQQRVGLKGQLFWIYKFRTMVTNPEKDIQLAATDDTRITKLGKFLRRFKIDELPQLFNVLKGDMSFVGYRPELPFYVERYTNSQRQLLSYKPGITDPATLYFRNESELLDQDDIIGSYTQQILPIKLKLSLTYARKANFCSDLICLFKTFFYTPTQKNKRIKATS